MQKTASPEDWFGVQFHEILSVRADDTWLQPRSLLESEGPSEHRLGVGIGDETPHLMLILLGHLGRKGFVVALGESTCNHADGRRRRSERRSTRRVPVLARTGSDAFSESFRAFDPEDVVPSAYKRLFGAIRADQSIDLSKGEFWKILAETARHKLFTRIERHEHRDELATVTELPTDFEAIELQPKPDEAASVVDRSEACRRE